jgi:1,4-alpha-glucan branching enzyme
MSTRLEVITIPPSNSEAPCISSSEEMREVRFGYFQPDAHEVFVVGSFNGWNPRATPLQRDSLGDWSVRLRLPPGEYHYRLMADGEWRDDPSAQQTAMNPFGGFDAVIVV